MHAATYPPSIFAETHDTSVSMAQTTCTLTHARIEQRPPGIRPKPRVEAEGRVVTSFLEVDGIQLHVTTVYAVSDPHKNGDAKRMQQVVVNSAKRAIDHASSSGAAHIILTDANAVLFPQDPSRLQYWPRWSSLRWIV